MTINDIAKLSGVSKATVSRVINGSKPVSPEVTRKVMSIIKENNFQPSRSARNLSNRESRLIGVIVPDFSNPIFAKVIEGIEAIALKDNYNIILCNSRLHTETELQYLNLLIDKEVDGLIYNGFNITKEITAKLEHFKVPIIMIGIENRNLPYPVVNINNYYAGKDVAIFLKNLGHRNTAMIQGALVDQKNKSDRVSGFLSIFPDSDLYKGNYKVSGGYNAMLEILKNKNRPSAIFCENDEMAIGAVKAATDSGLKVPNDISIIGFDNIEMSEVYNPSISTVSQPFTEMGSTAMAQLIDMISGDSVPDRTYKKYKIIKRQSVI